MKNSIILIMITCVVLTLNAQDKKFEYKLITGVRINPLLIYYQSEKIETVRLHGEIGALFNKRIYTSVGYTPYVNAIYNFNEYWFIGFDRKVPMSIVLAAEYMTVDKKFFIQFGPNIRMGSVGNFFVFTFRTAENSAWGVKIGIFIPLNVVLSQSKEFK